MNVTRNHSQIQQISMYVSVAVQVSHWVRTATRLWSRHVRMKAVSQWISRCAAIGLSRLPDPCSRSRSQRQTSCTSKSPGMHAWLHCTIEAAMQTVHTLQAARFDHAWHTDSEKDQADCPGLGGQGMHATLAPALMDTACSRAG